MKRFTLGASLVALLAVSARADARADFDPSVNGLRLSKDALRTIDFESADALVGVELLSWLRAGGYPTLERTPIASGADVAKLLTTTAEDAIEGSHAIRLAQGRGLGLTDPALFAAVNDGRFEVTLWARADGGAPWLQVVYDDDLETAGSGFEGFARVRGIRTGRETTDGWAEYSTGPLDGAVFGVPARAILVTPSPFEAAEATFLVDALEVRKVEGAPVAPVACTQANVDQVCGAEGDCMFGRCVSSAVTWGALPPPAHRAEIAERWVFWSTRLLGDRAAAKLGAEILAPGARALAAEATSSRQFFGGMVRLVNLLRDNHTSFGVPANFTSFSPQIQQSSSSALGACFGVVDQDLLGGGLGFAVFRASDDPTTGVVLKPGDVVTKIDDRDPKEWVDDVYPRFATTLPNDPAADWAAVAGDLARLLVTRASTVTLTRCASPSSCTGDDRETIRIEIGDLAYKAVTGQIPSGSRPFACSPRFSSSVTPLVSSDTGEDPVSVMTGPDGETRVQFDGFSGDRGWMNAMTNVFASRPAKVLMDAREGHGGYYHTLEHLFGLLRGTSDPMGVLSVGRATYGLSDAPWLFDRLVDCTAETYDNQWTCFAGSSNGFLAKAADPPGGATKIAWLNTRDVSANDFMPRLLQGRAGFRIFAPHPTAGAFGSVVQLPGIATGWAGGSIQIQDSRFAPDADGLKAARWESGHGVAPDVVVTQKLSDAVAGVDTILTAATEWLASP